MNQTVRKTSRPSSATRADDRPAPARLRPVEPTRIATAAENRVARRATRYAELRKMQDEIAAELREASADLIEDMKATGTDRVLTAHGLVSFLPETAPKKVPDVDAAVALLESKNIPQPPTMAAWLARHELVMPEKTKAGLPDRLEFRRSK